VLVLVVLVLVVLVLVVVAASTTATVAVVVLAMDLKEAPFRGERVHAAVIARVGGIPEGGYIDRHHLEYCLVERCGGRRGARRGWQWILVLRIKLSYRLSRVVTNARGRWTMFRSGSLLKMGLGLRYFSKAADRPRALVSPSF